MRTVIVDSQIVSSLQRCAARTNFYFNNNLRTAEKAWTLQKGTFIHEFFAVYYGARLNSDNVLDWPSCAHLAFTAQKPKTAELTIPDVEINNVLRSLEQYVELYKFEPLEVVFVESPFALELFCSEEEDLRIVYVGVVDLGCHIQGSSLKVFDHKSQSRKSDFLELDDQFQGYATAAKVNNLWVNVIGLQATIAPREKFRRQALSFTPYTLDRWKAHVIYWVKQYMVYHDSKGWPENHQGCNKFNLCEFYQICTAASDTARAWKMQSDYTIEQTPWDPTKILENRE